MSVMEELQKAMREVEECGEHHGYWYCISDILTVLICGMLCSLQTVDDIHEWSKAGPTRAFSREHFGIEKLPCRAQFYNILACVDAEEFNYSFTKWMRSILQNGVVGKTIAIDGKSVCPTDKLRK